MKAILTTTDMLLAQYLGVEGDESTLEELFTIPCTYVLDL